MNDVQLDKATDAKKLASFCNSEGIVRCWRLPDQLEDSDDDVVIGFAKQHGRILLTTDRTMPDEYPGALAFGSFGVLIIALGDASRQTMTHAALMSILATFKSDFTDWGTLDLRNSIIELQPRFIDVSHVAGERIERTDLCDRTAEDWQKKLRAALRLNAERKNIR
ncbi:MAG TPA: hypothetical protein VFW87_01355 [Pirellulales bacterium]|nr:hypothetical protein [Pirellulales bacterium]